MGITEPTHRYLTQTLTVPAGTLSSSPAFVDILPDNDYYTIEFVEIVYPFGVAALAGVAITRQGTWIVPWQQPNAYIMDDDDKLKIDVDYETSGLIRIQGINSDVNDHTFRVRISTINVTSTDTAIASNPILQPIA